MSDRPIEKPRSAIDPYALASSILPSLSEELIDAVLWNLTAFPCCSHEFLTKQLEEVRDGLAADKSINQQIGEVEEQMKEWARAVAEE